MSTAAFSPSPPRARLPFPYRSEADVVGAWLAALHGQIHWASIADKARPWARAAPDNPAPVWAMESLLREYPISTAEGLALMRLAEALLRVPDAETAIALTADQLGRADFEGAAEGSAHRVLASLSASAIALSKRFLPEGARYMEHMFVIAPAGAFVGRWLQSFREFPPRQKPGSFNLDRVMEAVMSGNPSK